MVQEKQNEIINGHLQNLREDADIETFPQRAGGDDLKRVVATVNGEEILNESFLASEGQQMQQYTAMGLDPESEEGAALREQLRPQILDGLVNVEIVIQRAKDEGFNADDEDIQQQYQQLSEQFGGEQALEQQLENEGITKQKLLDDISSQMSINIYLEDYISENTDPEDFSFSEEELRARFEQIQQQQMQQ